jgi:heme exporter protein A
MQAARHKTRIAPAMQIEASDLSVERGGRRIFTGLDLRLAAGEALAVTGPNGAGKSTLLRALAGLLPLISGHIAITPATEARRAELCHYIGHLDALKPSLTLAENVAFCAALLGGGETGAALTRLGLAAIADLPAAYLSAGQRRRAALARLVAAKRPIWLLDEPLTALDTASQGVVSDLMKEHLASGGLIVAATHAPLPVAARELVLGRAA